MDMSYPEFLEALAKWMEENPYQTYICNSLKESGMTVHEEHAKRLKDFIELALDEETRLRKEEYDCMKAGALLAVFELAHGENFNRLQVRLTLLRDLAQHYRTEGAMPCPVLSIFKNASHTATTMDGNI